MRNEPPKRLEILEKNSSAAALFYSGNDNGREVIIDLFTGSVAGNVTGYSCQLILFH